MNSLIFIPWEDGEHHGGGGVEGEQNEEAGGQGAAGTLILPFSVTARLRDSYVHEGLGRL